MLPEPMHTIITAIGGLWLLTIILGFLYFAGRNIFIFTDVRHPFSAAVKTVTTLSSHVATWLALVLVTGYSVTSIHDRYGIWPFLASPSHGPRNRTCSTPVQNGQRAQTASRPGPTTHVQSRRLISDETKPAVAIISFSDHRNRQLQTIRLNRFSQRDRPSMQILLRTGRSNHGLLNGGRLINSAGAKASSSTHTEALWNGYPTHAARFGNGNSGVSMSIHRKASSRVIRRSING